MLGLQVAIGAVNDRVDRFRDAAEKPAKPIPSGLATSGHALGLAIAAGGAGLALSAASGGAVLAVAALGLGLGLAYDLRLSRGAWSWLPLALALPLLPIHAWLGATGTVPPGLLTLAATAIVAGAALALSNGLVDAERDARSNRRAIAVVLGAGRAWVVHAVLLLVVAGLAVAFAPAVAAVGGSAPGTAGTPGAAGPVPVEVLRGLRTWGVAVGVLALALGALVLRAARPRIRERGWELEAVGVAGVGLGWLAGTAAGGGGA